MKLRIDSHYSDGFSASRVETVREPRRLTDDWWETVVAPLAGDWHGVGAGRALGFCHTATVIAARHRRRVNMSREWSG